MGKKAKKIYVATSHNGRRAVNYFTLDTAMTGRFVNGNGKPVAARIEVGSVATFLVQLLVMLQGMKKWVPETLRIGEYRNLRVRGSRRISKRWKALQDRVFQNYRARFYSATRTSREGLRSGSYVTLKGSDVLAVALSAQGTHIEFSDDTLRLDLLVELIPALLSDEVVTQADPRFGLDFLILSGSVFGVRGHFPVSAIEPAAPKIDSKLDGETIAMLKRQVINELTLADLPEALRTALMEEASAALPQRKLTGDAADLEAWEKRLEALATKLTTADAEVKAAAEDALKKASDSAARTLAAIATHGAAIPHARKTGLTAIRAIGEEYFRTRRA